MSEASPSFSVQAGVGASGAPSTDAVQPPSPAPPGADDRALRPAFAAGPIGGSKRAAAQASTTTSQTRAPLGSRGRTASPF